MREVGFSRIEVKCDNITGCGTTVRIDGQEIHGVRSIDYHVDVETSFTTVNLECYGAPDFDCIGKVVVNAIPEEGEA